MCARSQLYFEKIVPVLAGLTMEFYGGDRAVFAGEIAVRVAAVRDAALTEYVFELAMETDSAIVGTAGILAVMGTPRDDLIAIGHGDHVATGGAGHDSYVYALGDGTATIDENQSTDQIFLVGIKSTDAVCEHIANTSDLRLTITGSTGDAIIIRGFFAATGVERLVFSDGVHIGAGAVERILGVNDTIKEGIAAGEFIVGTYHRLDPEVIWNVATVHLKPLHVVIKKMLADLSQPGLPL